MSPQGLCGRDVPGPQGLVHERNCLVQRRPTVGVWRECTSCLTARVEEIIAAQFLDLQVCQLAVLPRSGLCLIMEAWQGEEVAFLAPFGECCHRPPAQGCPTRSTYL